MKQILLLHANEINADHLDALIEIFRKRGYSFITLEEALSDPGYSLEVPVARRGLSWRDRRHPACIRDRSRPGCHAG